MKIFTGLVLMFLSFTVYAEGKINLDNIDMQKMMKSMILVSQCMKNVDHNELKTIESLARQERSTIKSLCAAGDRKTAQEKAVLFSTKLSAYPSVKIARDCAKKYSGVLPVPTYHEMEQNFAQQHICDIKK